METKVTSKTSSLQALLLRAWRERWTDLQWGIQIKTILPRGVSGDVHNLADCILQQALVGPGPNQLVLSYLKHSLSSQLVSYAAVLQRISKYDGYHKPHCIISLLEFVQAILGRMTCRSRAEEGSLAAAVLSLVNWLLTIALHALHKLNELGSSPEHATMLVQPAALIANLLSCDFATAMLCLARLDDKDLHSDVVRKCFELEAALAIPLTFKVDLNAEDTIRVLVKLRSLGLPGPGAGPATEDGVSCEPVTYCLQPLLAVEVLLNPSSDTQLFVNQVLMVQRLKGYTMPRLYAEVMRACLISLKDVLGSNEQSQWGAFTFLKVPHILLQLHRTVRGGTEGTTEQPDFSKDVVASVDLLLQYTPLLDTVDVKCSCNCVECLLTELARVGLVTEQHVKLYAARREGVVSAVQKVDIATQTAAIPKVIIRAEPTLARILKTLDADYLKIQDALLSVLSQVLTGKSFELILAVATVQGKLRTFVTKLINFNECSRLPANDETSAGAKSSQTRAMLFDISFLMLSSIVQTYGSDVVLGEEGGTGGDSFFEQWVRECMAERDHPKSPDVMLQGCEPSKLEALLAQFSSPDIEFKTSQVRWHEVCRHVPAATRELLLAWEQGALSPTDVKRALDAMRSRMGCLPVCAAAWLCSYMQILDQDALLKPMNMVQQFLTPLEDMPQQDNYKERSSLTFQIIRKMQYDVHPPTMTKAKLLHSIVSRSPVSEQLSSVWADTHQRGWINIEATHTLESLLSTGGAQWFVSIVIKEVLKYRYRDDLDKAVDLAFAIFHLDIENCTLTLLQHALPLYLHNQLQGEELVEPQASALAKLSAYCVFAALEAPNFSSPVAPGRKRSRRDMDPEDLEGILPSAKVLRLSSTDSQGEASASLFGTAAPTAGTSTPVGTPEVGSPLPVLREPLRQALTRIFQAFSAIAQDGEVSQHTHFVFKFLEFCVLCGKDRTRLVLQVMPGTLVPSLLSSLPDLFTTNLLLRLYDTGASMGRKDTARDLCMLRNMALQPPTSIAVGETGIQQA